MRTFSAHAVVHTDLRQTASICFPSSHSLWFFWYSDYPLGHFWYDPETGLTAEEWARQLFPAVQRLSPEMPEQAWSSMAQCFFGNNGTSTPEWQKWLPPLFPPVATAVVSMPSLSVVICTRNRSQDLSACLKALFASTDLCFETIVVDNAPSDNSTAAVVKAFPQVKYVLEPKKGLDNARNTGARMASGQLVAFTDDDVQVHPTWIQSTKQAFDQPHTMAVTGLVLPQALPTEAAYVFEKHWGFNRGYQRKVFGAAYFNQHLPHGVPVWDIGAGANMAFRKEVFDLVGYFDPRLDVGASGCSGDSEFWYRILAEGWDCVYDPSAVVFHRHRETQAALQQQLNGYLRGQMSSLLVQYERWGHRGNLKRAGHYLPQYYLYRLWDKIRGRDVLLNAELWAEIRGCMGGAWYYWQHRQKRADHLPYPLLLHAPAKVGPQTLVSVVITNYNYGRFLQQCLDSVLQQSHSAVEIIVVDDGSTDDSLQLLAQYPQAKVLHTQRAGVATARNQGVAAAKGDFVLFLDADDWLPREAVEVNLYHFKQHPEMVMVGGSHCWTDAAGNVLGKGAGVNKKGEAYADLLMGNFWAAEGALLFRRQIFEAFRFNKDRSKAEFYELNLSIARFFPILAHDRPVLYYRKHADSKSAHPHDMWDNIKNIMDLQVTKLYTPQEKKAHEQGLVNWQAHYSHGH